MTSKKLGLKVFASFILCIVLLFFGMALSIVASVIIQYPTLNRVMASLAWVFMALILIYVMMHFFSRISKKLLNITFLGVIVFGIIGVISVHQYERLQDRLRIDEPGINLYDYQPFKNNTTLARLDHTASFEMGDNLLRIDGIATLYPVYAAFVEATYPHTNYYDPLDELNSVVRVSNQQDAYQRLLNGEVDILFGERPSDALIANAFQQGITLNVTVIGYETVVFYVHEDNPIESLSFDDIINIYSGNITNWAELGGYDASIKAFQRVETSPSQAALKHIMGAVSLMTPPMERVVESGNIVLRPARYTNHSDAIGFSLRYHMHAIGEQHSVKVLPIEGYGPTLHNISSALYPIRSELVAVTANSMHAQLDDFLAWILSSEGQYLLEQSGFVSLYP